MDKIRSFRFETRGEAETVAAGVGAGPLLRGGDVIVLTGGLGAGKTWFTRGLCAGLGINKGVRSPSFSVIINHVPGDAVSAAQGIDSVHHVDLYRLNSEDELAEWGVPDLLADDKAAVIVEWGKPLVEYLDEGYIHVKIERSAGNDAGRRRFTVTCHGKEIDRCMELEKKIKSTLAYSRTD